MQNHGLIEVPPATDTANMHAMPGHNDHPSRGWPEDASCSEVDTT
jgi:hypothetical protein